MAKTKQSLPRGIYEKVPGTGVYWIHYTSSDGQRHREKAGNLTAAKRLLNVRLAERLSGKLPELKRTKALLFGELLDAAVKHAKAQDTSYHAHDLELKYRIVREAFGNRVASSITKSEIIDWLSAQQDERDWAPSSRNRYQAAISLAFKVAVEDNKLAKNPAAGIARLAENNQVTRFLSPEEEVALTAAIDARFPSYVPTFQLAVHTGARLSELLRARIGDYNPATGKMTIHQRKLRNAPPQRYVPLTPIGITAYQKLAGKRRKGEPLCVNAEGNPLTETRYWFDPCVEAAGLVNFTWHCNRHTAASRWVMKGVPLAVVAEYLGHQNIAMTMRYAHLQPDNHHQAVAAMMSFYE